MLRYLPRFEIAIALVCAVGLGSFAYHGFLGSRSIAYQNELSAQLNSLETKKLKLADEHRAIQAKVELIRPEAVDPDLVDELARSELGLVKANDLIVVVKK